MLFELRAKAKIPPFRQPHDEEVWCYEAIPEQGSIRQVILNFKKLSLELAAAQPEAARSAHLFLRQR